MILVVGIKQVKKENKMDELIKSLESISELMGSNLFSVGDIEDELLETNVINKY